MTEMDNQFEIQVAVAGIDPKALNVEVTGRRSIGDSRGKIGEERTEGGSSYQRVSGRISL